MKEKIPGYTAYVRKKAEAAFDLNHQPIQDFFTAMQLFYKRINKQPRLIKASDLAQELEATASMSPEITVRRTASRLARGSAPGSPRQTGQTLTFGSAPEASEHPQNIFVRVLSWT